MARPTPKTIYATLLFLLFVQAILQAMHAESVGGAGGETLEDYVGREFKIYVIRKIQDNSGGRPGIISPGGFRERLTYVLSFVAREADPGEILGSMKLVGETEYLGETIRVYRAVYRAHEIVAAIGDLGSFYLRVDDGSAPAYSMCGNDTPELLKSTHIVLYGGMEVEYSGQYGEQKALARPGLVCNLVNGTTTCSRPANYTVQEILYNPYEVYYVYLDGLRIEPPIRIRCMVPKYSDGLSVAYMEGFAPPEISRKITVVLTRDRVKDVVEMFRSEGYNVKGAGDIGVEDVYLSLAPGQKLVPVFKLRYGNAVAWVGLDDSGVTLLGFGVLAGGGSTDDGDQGIRVDWKSIISRATSSTDEGGRGHYIIIYIAVLILLASVATVFYIKRLGKTR